MVNHPFIIINKVGATDKKGKSMSNKKSSFPVSNIKGPTNANAIEPMGNVTSEATKLMTKTFSREETDPSVRRIAVIKELSRTVLEQKTPPGNDNTPGETPPISVMANKPAKSKAPVMKTRFVKNDGTKNAFPGPEKPLRPFHEIMNHFHKTGTIDRHEAVASINSEHEKEVSQAHRLADAHEINTSKGNVNARSAMVSAHAARKEYVDAAHQSTNKKLATVHGIFQRHAEAFGLDQHAQHIRQDGYVPGNAKSQSSGKSIWHEKPVAPPPPAGPSKKKGLLGRLKSAIMNKESVQVDEATRNQVSSVATRAAGAARGNRSTRKTPAAIVRNSTRTVLKSIKKDVRSHNQILSASRARNSATFRIRKAADQGKVGI